MTQERGSWGERLKKYGTDALFLCCGCAVGAFSTMCVLIPNGLTSGGVTGLVRIVHELLPMLNFSVIYYGFSILIWIACLLTLGFKEARKILVMTVMYPLFLMLFEQLNLRTGLGLLEERDVLLAALYCGLFYGVCNGIVFSRGFSFGGADTVAKIIMKRLFPHLSIGRLLLVMDIVVIVTSGFLFGRNIALYAIVTSVILARVTDYVLYGFQTRFVEMEIISECHEEIVDYVMNEIERGVSSSVIRGEYTGKERRRIFTLCSPRESMLIKTRVARTDRNALITIKHVESVWGRAEGFRDIDTE